MRKVLLFSIIFLFTGLICFGYETIIFHFPDGENWEKAYYKKRGYEAILQYVPLGQTSENWKRTIIVHSYNHNGIPVRYFAQNEIRKMKRINPTSEYQTLKLKENEALFTRCTEKYKDIQPQCEFLRVSQPHGGIVTIQYINRNKDDFEKNYTLWLETVKGARFYNSYYRDERIFDKSIYFEL